MARRSIDISAPLQNDVPPTRPGRLDAGGLEMVVFASQMD